MAKIKIVYDSDEEVEAIVRHVEEFLNMKNDNIDIKKRIQNILQKCFDDGRSFQKNVITNNRDLKIE